MNSKYQIGDIFTFASSGVPSYYTSGDLFIVTELFVNLAGFDEVCLTAFYPPEVANSLYRKYFRYEVNSSCDTNAKKVI